MAAYGVREMVPEEYPRLADFLYMAVFVPHGQTTPPRDILALPEMQVYI